MATQSFVDFAGLQHYDQKLQERLAHPVHSYTVAKSSAKNWFRFANANASQMDTEKPLHFQFMLTAWNSGAAADYYQKWFVDGEVFGRNSGLRIFGNSNAPFSQMRILYENTVADIDADDHPALDLYLNYVLDAAATNIEIEELYNEGWTFVADGALSASTIPTGFESRAGSAEPAGIQRSANSTYSDYTAIQRSNFSSNFTLADNTTYRARTLNCTGTITVTVPSINSVWSWFIIKNFNTTSGVITVHPSTTSVLIDGSNADITLQPGEYIVIQSRAANSYTIIGDGRWKSGSYRGILKDNSTEDVNTLFSPLVGTKQTYYTTTNGYTTLVNVPAAVNTTLESRTLRKLSDSDWTVEQICHNTNGLYYRKGTNSGWSAWKEFAFTNSNITGNANTATKATQDASGNVITTTYATKSELPSDYVGATSSANGTHGLVPAATSAQKDNYLKGDGTWSNSGLISSVDKTKLDSLSQYPRIDNFYINDSYVNANETNSCSLSTTGPTKLVVIGGDGIETTLVQQAADASQEASVGVRLTVRPDGFLATNSGLRAYNGKLSAPVYTGATSEDDGIAGLVPIAYAGDQDKYLMGDGTWGEIATAKEVGYVTTTPTTQSASSLQNEAFIFCESNSGSESLIPVTTTGNQTISGTKKFIDGIYGGVVTLASNESTFDLSRAAGFLKTVTANTTFSFSNVPSNAICCITVILTNGGNYAVTWPSSVKWTGNTTPVLTQNGKDVLTFITMDGGTTWFGTTTCIGVTA